MDVGDWITEPELHPHYRRGWCARWLLDSFFARFRFAQLGCLAAQVAVAKGDEVMKALPGKLLPLTLFAIAVTSPFCVQPAEAYTVTLQQVGSDVVANGSGAINLTGLFFFGSGSSFITTLLPSSGRISTGPPPSGLGSVDLYRIFSGPANFGSGGQHNATESLSSGDFVGIQASVIELFVPHGYISNSALSSSATWTGATFASLGATPGTYVWTW